MSSKEQEARGKKPKKKSYSSHLTPNSLLNNRGMALLMTILIIVLLSLLVLDINERSVLAYTKAKNSVSSLKTYYIMRSGVSAAMGFMDRDAKENSIDTLSEDWAQGVKNFPVGDGTVTVDIIDEASKFNINTIVNHQGLKVEKGVERFGRLLRETGLDEGLSEKAVLWLQEKRGNYAYAFRDISELLLVPEFTQDDLNKLKGYITVHTQRGNNNININTAGRELLSALSPVLTESLIQAVIDYRKEHPFANIGDLKKVQGIDDAVLEKFSDAIDVRSYYFSVTAEAKVSDTVRKGMAVISRRGGKVKIAAWKEE